MLRPSRGKKSEGPRFLMIRHLSFYVAVFVALRSAEDANTSPAGLPASQSAEMRSAFSGEICYDSCPVGLLLLLLLLFFIFGLISILFPSLALCAHLSHDVRILTNLLGEVLLFLLWRFSSLP